jgi:hypothetical protein
MASAPVIVRSDEHAQGAEVCAPSVGVGFEVAELLVAPADQGAGEFEVAAGGQQGGTSSAAWVQPLLNHKPRSYRNRAYTALNGGRTLTC